MFKSIIQITLAVFALSSASLSAQQPEINILPVSGDDVCKVLGIVISKTEINFGAPRFVTIRLTIKGRASEHPVDFPAASKWTLMTYIQREGNMVYWLSTDENHERCGTVSFPKEEGESAYMELVKGVYTVQGAHSEADARKQPYWKLEVLASDQNPSPGGTGSAH